MSEQRNEEKLFLTKEELETFVIKKALILMGGIIIGAAIGTWLFVF